MEVVLIYKKNLFRQDKQIDFLRQVVAFSAEIVPPDLFYDIICHPFK